VKIRDGVGEEGEGWFAGRVLRKVGDGETTSFWLDRWVGDVPLCRCFSCLFNLSENKLAMVASMFSLGWEAGGGAWQWRRRLWVWEEEMLEECRIFISNVFLQPNVTDTWQWLPDLAWGYSVHSGYEILTSQDHHVLDAADDLVWHPRMPLKVSILAWRMLRDRLPTRLNLLHRGIITDADISCVSGVVMMNLLTTCFYIVISLVLFGIRCGCGLVFQELITKILDLIFFTSLTI